MRIKSNGQGQQAEKLCDNMPFAPENQAEPCNHMEPPTENAKDGEKNGCGAGIVSNDFENIGNIPPDLWTEGEQKEIHMDALKAVIKGGIPRCDLLEHIEQSGIQRWLSNEEIGQKGNTQAQHQSG